MPQFPNILITRNNDNLSILLGGKHYLFQGTRVEELFDAAMIYKQALAASVNMAATYERLQELLKPILRKDVAKYFTTDGKHVYLGNTDIPVPDSLFSLVHDFIHKGYPIESFANFWRFCLMNPNDDARDRFFDYCKTYGITITDKGYAVLYKAVNKRQTLPSTANLAEFVSMSWLKVKRWKKSPANYFVNYFDDTNVYSLTTEETEYTVGNLAEMHENITELSINDNLSFKPLHSGNYGMDIQLGVAVTMPREQCDSNIANECSLGLHVGSFKYVKAFASSNNTILACLVNPMDIVALPAYDNSKIRTCRYLPYAIIERENDGTWTELDSVGFEDDFILQEDEVVLQAIKENPAQLQQTTIDEVLSCIPVAKVVTYEFDYDCCDEDCDCDLDDDEYYV